VPAAPPYIIEPMVFGRFSDLLPERTTSHPLEPSFGAILWSHPLGCHRPRIPERVVFEKLVQVLLCGCAYERIADGSSCSASTLSGIIATSGSGWGIERLREMALEAYDRAIGLQSSRSWRWVALQPGRPAGATGRVRTPWKETTSRSGTS